MHTSLKKITPFKALITSGYMIFFKYGAWLGGMEAVGWYTSEYIISISRTKKAVLLR